MRIKTAVVIFVSAAFVILDLLALDDITTGHEPNFYAEWATLVISVAWFTAVADFWWRRKRDEPDKA